MNVLMLKADDIMVKKFENLLKKIVLLSLIVCAGNSAFAQQKTETQTVASRMRFSKELRYPELVKRFYELNNGQVFWLQSGEDAVGKRVVLQLMFDQCASVGLRSAKYARSVKANNYTSADIAASASDKLLAADMIITDAALSFCKDIYQGDNMKKWISYDEISARCAAADEERILNGLKQTTTADELQEFISLLEPHEKEYMILKNALAQEIASGNSFKAKQLTSSVNFYRWIHHFNLGEFVVVNTGSAIVQYYSADTLMLQMKAVVGTPNTKTPRFAAYCSQVILYPYWNVPRSIAVNELLPRFKKSQAMLAFLNMEVLDSKGHVIDPKKIHWASLNRNNFPYRFREMTGCVNPLGVVKFDITDPFSVYMHDTNFKGAFLAKNRYYSHGCIRVEEPVALATALLKKQVDTAFLQACYRDLQPVTMKLPKPVPVFVVYMTAEVNQQGKLEYFRDQYGLLK